MKRCTGMAAFGFIALLLAGCGGTGGSTASWQTVTADDGSYTVNMPEKPKAVTQSVDVPQGKIDVKMEDLSTQYVEYSVGYSEFPAGFLASMGSDSSALFARSRDSVVKQRQAKVLEDSGGKVGDFDSRTVVMTFAMPENSDNVTMKEVMILAKGRMYVVQSIVLAKGPAEASADAAKFHDSFKLNMK